MYPASLQDAPRGEQNQQRIWLPGSPTPEDYGAGAGESLIRPGKDRRGEEGTAVVSGTFYEKRLTNGPSKKTICPFTWLAAVICLCPGQSQKEKDP